jgi:hypothetical protein
MSVLSRLVNIALAEVGTREEGGNNKGKRIKEYQKATWLEPDAWPWCAAFTAWLLQEWLKDDEVVFALSIPPDKENEWRCKDASAFGWEKWANAKGLKVLPETAKAKAGDIVIFDFSHIGIVVADQVGVTIQTVEGNTNGAGDRESTTGDGVWQKKRNRSLVKCYIRLTETV